jgi:hypothetical protein
MIEIDLADFGKPDLGWLATWCNFRILSSHGMQKLTRHEIGCFARKVC